MCLAVCQVLEYTISNSYNHTETAYFFQGVELRLREADNLKFIEPEVGGTEFQMGLLPRITFLVMFY